MQKNRKKEKEDEEEKEERSRKKKKKEEEKEETRRRKRRRKRKKRKTLMELNIKQEKTKDSLWSIIALQVRPLNFRLPSVVSFDPSGVAKPEN